MLWQFKYRLLFKALCVLTLIGFSPSAVAMWNFIPVTQSIVLSQTDEFDEVAARENYEAGEVRQAAHQRTRNQSPNISRLTADELTRPRSVERLEERVQLAELNLPAVENVIAATAVTSASPSVMAAVQEASAAQLPENLPADQQNRLDAADALLSGGDYPGALAEYQSILDEYSRQPAAVHANRRFSTVFKEVGAGQHSAEAVGAMIAALPTSRADFENLNSTEARYNMLDYYEWKAGNALARGGMEAAQDDYVDLMECSWIALTSDLNHPLSVAIAQKYIEAATFLGSETLLAAGENLDAFTRSYEMSYSVWAAHCLLAYFELAIGNDWQKARKHCAAIAGAADSEFLSGLQSDTNVYEWVRALNRLEMALANQRLGRIHIAQPIYDEVIETFPQGGEIRESAVWNKTRVTTYRHRNDPARCVEELQTFIANEPNSVFTAQARLELATIYERAGDYDSAQQLYGQVIHYHGGTDTAETAQRAIFYLVDHVKNSQEVAYFTDDAMEFDFDFAQKCGPIALQRLLALLGVDSTVEELEAIAGTDETGTSMQALIDAARAKGIALEGVAASHVKELPTPFLPFVQGNHFVLVTNADENGVTVQDAINPAEIISHAEFAGMWDGEALVVSSAIEEQLARMAREELLAASGGNIRAFHGGLFPYDHPHCGGSSNNTTAGGGGTCPPGNSCNGQSPKNGTGTPPDPRIPGNNGSPKATTGLWQDGVHAMVHTGVSGLWLVETDISVPTVGGGQLNFSRTYLNKYGKHEGRTIGSNPWENNIGEGWYHDWNMTLELEDNASGDDYITIWAPEDDGLPPDVEGEYPASTTALMGQACVNVLNDDGSLHYESCPPKSVSATALNVTGNAASGGGKSLATMPSGREHEFSEFSANDRSRLDVITDPYGNEFTLDYDGAIDTGKLTKISPPTGDPRYLQLSYSGNLITKVELKKTASPSDTVLQTVEYFYDGNDELTKVEDDNGNTVLYEYGSDVSVTGSRYIKKITDKRGKVTDIAWTYGQNPDSIYEAYLIEMDLPNGLTAVYDRNQTTDACTITLEDSIGTVLRKRVHTPLPDWAYKSQFIDYYIDTTNYERWSYNYYTNRRLAQVTGPGANSQEYYTYDSEDRMSTRRYGSNGEVTYSYATGGWTPTKVTGLDSLDTTIVMNSEFQPTEITHPRWDSGTDGWEYYYNSNGQVTKATNPIEEDVTYTYDSMGNLSTVTVDPTGLDLETDYDYDDYGNVTQVTDPRGKLWKYEYDTGGCGSCGGAGGAMTKFTDPNNEVTEYEYDDNGNVTSVTDAETRETLYYYDDLNRLTKVEPVITGTNPTMTMAYNLIGEMTKVTDFEGNDTFYEYDHIGRVTTVEDDANDTVVEYAYDSLGRLTSVKDGELQETLYYYDDDNLLTKVVDDEGKTVKYEYDSAKRLTKVGAGSAGTSSPTKYHYSSTTGLMTKVDYYYDTTNFDTVDYTYDDLARVDELDDWIADDAGNVNLKYYYDKAGRLTKQRDYDASNLTYAYDDNGNVTSMTDYHSNTTTYAYDNASQLTSMTAPGSKTWTFAYNDIGQITSQVAPNAMMTTWDYDERNRLDKIEHLTAATGGTVVEKFDYSLNDAGNITKITHLDNFYWDYGYDVRDRLTSAKLHDGSKTRWHETYVYDDADNMLTKNAPRWDAFNDGETGDEWTLSAAGSWEEDEAMQLSAPYSGGFTWAKRAQAEGDTEIWFSYVCNDDSDSGYRAYFRPRYTDSDNWVQIMFWPGQASLRQKDGGTVTDFETDTAVDSDEGQWYEVYVKLDGANIDVYRRDRGSSDAFTLILSTTAATETTSTDFYWTMSADADYSLDDWAVLKDGGAVYDTTTFAYNTANELTSSTVNGTTTTYAYDDWGQMTNKAISGSYNADLSWRYGGFLEEYDSDFVGEGTVTYLTGGNEKRRKRTEGSDVTWYNWQGLNCIQEEDGSGDLERTYIGRNMAHVDGTNPVTGDYAYYLRDQIQSTRVIYDGSKNRQTNIDYSPYGETVSGEYPSLTPRRFTGHDYDSATGMHFAPFRYYDGYMTQWISRDPLGNVDGPNLYKYVRGNPIGLSDPDGRQVYEGNSCEEIRAALTVACQTAAMELLKQEDEGSVPYGTAFNYLQACLAGAAVVYQMCLEGRKYPPRSDEPKYNKDPKPHKPIPVLPVPLRVPKRNPAGKPAGGGGGGFRLTPPGGGCPQMGPRGLGPTRPPGRYSGGGGGNWRMRW